MNNMKLTLSQYLISFSVNNDSVMNNNVFQNMVSDLASEQAPEGVNQDVFESFFRKVLHEESDYILHFNDAIFDQCIWDYYDDSEDDNRYVFGFIFEDSYEYTEVEMTQVFSEIIIPLIRRYFPTSVIGNKIETYFEYKMVEEGSIHLQ